jgi:hypothetical protein
MAFRTGNCVRAPQELQNMYSTQAPVMKFEFLSASLYSSEATKYSLTTKSTSFIKGIDEWTYSSMHS